MATTALPVEEWMCDATRRREHGPEEKPSPEPPVREELERSAAPQPAHRRDGDDHEHDDVDPVHARRSLHLLAGSGPSRCLSRRRRVPDPRMPDPRVPVRRGKIGLPRTTAGGSPGGERAAVPHFDDHPTDTEPAGPASAPGGPGAAEPAQAPGDCARTTGVARSPVAASPAGVATARTRCRPATPFVATARAASRPATPAVDRRRRAAPQRSARRPATGLSRFAGSAPLDVLGRPLASFFKRALAIAVDFLVLSFALSEFGHEVFPLVLSSANNKPPSGQLMEFLGVSALVWIGYLTLLGSSRRGQTLGMMLYGIAVRDDAGGGQVSVGRATLRSVILLGLSGFFVDLIWPLWDKKRQSLHDKAARTVVVDVRLAALAEQLRQAGR